MEYLTTHDLVWINNIVTGTIHPYDYFKLEAAVAGQYKYGDSQDVPAQATTMLTRLLEARAFAAGNLRTALIATLSFLNVNGYATIANDEEVANLLLAASHRDQNAGDVVASLAAPSRQGLPDSVTLRKLITHECNHHVDALKRLASGD